MPAASRAPLVALLTVLQRRFPGLDDPARLIKEGAVLVNGVPAESPRTRVRADAAIRIRHPRPLRGTIKLAHALAAFGINAAGAVALDLGAAAGGFFPGRSSALGGIDEFPLLREIRRSSRATRSSSSAILASLSSSSARSRSFASRSRPFSERSAATSTPGTPGVPGVSGTPELHQSRPS